MYGEFVKNFKFSEDSESFLLSLTIFGVMVVVVVLLMLYYKHMQRRSQFRHFLHLLAGRDIEQQDIKKLFNYLYKHKIEPKMILESEEVMERAVKECGLDVESMRQKLGFDKDELVKRFMQRQNELRKKWNAH